MNNLEIRNYSFEEKIEYSENYQKWNAISATVKNISYEDFFENFMVKNLPCIVKNVSTSWKCTKEWVTNDTINYNYLKEHYGDLVAPVANCNHFMFDSHSKQEMSIFDYMNYMQSDYRKELLYLKDWHLKRTRPHDFFYEIPTIFSSDWLNEYALDKNEDDFMFVYIGPKTSWTPLHADVYSSYSWSVNIVGRKKWILFPPGEEAKLKDSFGNLPQTFYPEKFEYVNYFTIIQEKGDAIFVPSGWYHQVVNELDTISINHNWINACNIKHTWEALVKVLISVEHEIMEFSNTPEFPEQCQVILKSLFGMDFAAFINLVCHIGQKRLEMLNGSNNLVLGRYVLGKNQIIYDLKQILKILDLCINHPVFLNHKHLITSNIQYDFIELKDSITTAQK